MSRIRASAGIAVVPLLLAAASPAHADEVEHSVKSAMLAHRSSPRTPATPASLWLWLREDAFDRGVLLHRARHMAEAHDPFAAACERAA